MLSGDGAGIQQRQRLVGQLAQRGLPHPLGGGVDRRQRLLQLDLAGFALNTVFRMNDLRAVVAAFDLAVGGHAAAGGQAVLHCGVEVEEAHGEDAGAVADLAGQHAAAAEAYVAAQHFPFYRGVDARQQIVDRIEAGAVFVAQRQVQQQILNGLEAKLGQFARLAGANPGKRGEWDSIQQAAFHLRTVACMAAHHSALATT